MKSPYTHKAFVLLTIVIFIFACKQPDEPLLKSVVSIRSAENVTTNSATLVAMVTPNEESTITFEYRPSSSQNWLSKVMTEKLSGTTAIKASVNLDNLVPSTQYIYRVKSLSLAGETISSTIGFTTGTLLVAYVQAYEAENVAMTSAKVKASVTPNQDNTSASIEYRKVNASVWTTQTSATILSGANSVDVNFDLSALELNTKYEYRIKAVNVAGESISDILSFTTYAVSDADGNLYHTVTIGTQTWLKENFRGTHYANGDPIPNLTNSDAWLASTSGAYCYYNNDVELGKTYSALYNWYITSDPRGLIVGFKTPSGDDYVTMKNFIGRGYSAYALMEKGTSHWIYSNGTDAFGFTALPNGTCGLTKTTGKFGFTDLNSSATFWCSDSYWESSQIALIEPSFSTMLNIGAMFKKRDGFGLRLLKN
jgi:uncharacterized protein (TIGR02145 family)